MKAKGWIAAASVPVLSLVVYVISAWVETARWESTLPDDAKDLLLGIYREEGLDLVPEEVQSVELEKVETDCWTVTFDIEYLTGESETIEGTLTYDPDKEELELELGD